MKYAIIRSDHISVFVLRDIDEMPMAIAWVTTQFYFLTCISAFAWKDINECNELSAACDTNSRCEDRNGSFACCMETIINECIGKLLLLRIANNRKDFS